MTWISDSQLAKMRADVLNMLPGTAIIQTVTRSSDGAGGWSESWAAITAGTVACRLDPYVARDMLAVLQGREAISVVYQATFPYNAPVSVDRRIVIGSNTYEVIKMDVDHSWNVSIRVVVAEVR